MAFRFPLATVLRFRDNVERREELALQKILQEIARTRLQIEQLNAAIVQAQADRNKSLLQSISAYQLQVMARDVDAMIDRKKALIESLVPLEQKRQTQMLAYQAAHRARQMLSDMATRQRDAYEQQQARAQQKFLDDIFAARAQRS
jgi:flagellar export protein FliJ